MLLEDIVLAVAIGVVLLIVAGPIVRFLKVAQWRERDPLAEAKERLKTAVRDAEIARLNREADRIYESLYDEALTEDRGRGDSIAGARAAPESREGPDPGDGVGEKGNRHGQG